MFYHYIVNIYLNILYECVLLTENRRPIFKLNTATVKIKTLEKFKDKQISFCQTVTTFSVT